MLLLNRMGNQARQELGRDWRLDGRKGEFKAGGGVQMPRESNGRIWPGLRLDLGLDLGLGLRLNSGLDLRLNSGLDLRLDLRFDRRSDLEFVLKIAFGDWKTRDGSADFRRDHDLRYVDPYSGLVSEEPENAATTAGLRTIAMKVRPIRRSCIGGSPLWGSSELCHSLILKEFDGFPNTTRRCSEAASVLIALPQKG
jgi:hypothetical protein